MKNANRAYLPLARQVQRLDRANIRPSIAGSRTCNETAWKFLIELYVWPDDLHGPSAEDIALAIDLPLSLTLRIAVPLRNAGLVRIDDGATTADLHISLTDLGCERVGAFLKEAADYFSDETLSAVG